ncbi:hypothetical protein OKW45_003951 [Paraburkholderia sp. WSM4175]|uniref:hypothetical protein n=1 Tax=Paraburkholderia sp. WSM4175 TaxID=2991072 RepID=UPI003D1E6209
MKEQIIQRSEFSSFVWHSDKLSPNVTEAVIEIVSPVIVQGDIQWKGRWNDQNISFAMDDRAFKEQVFRKEERFQHGDCFRCILETDRQLDEAGKAKVTGYRVTTVLDKVDGTGKTHETPQGRERRFQMKHAGGQPDLFGGDVFV